MEYHIIEIVRLVTCVTALAIGVAVMIKADGILLRAVTAAASIAAIYFNEYLGHLVYLAIGSALEALIASLGVTFVISLVAVIALFPVIAVVRWLIN